MRAALFSEHGGPEVIQISEVEAPKPGPSQVRIAVRAASLNHLDLWARRGLPFEIPMPHIGGSDVAGVVDALGTGVEEGAGGVSRLFRPVLPQDGAQSCCRGTGNGPHLGGPGAGAKAGLAVVPRQGGRAQRHAAHPVYPARSNRCGAAGALHRRREA